VREPRPERFRLHEVRERVLAVDLDDRQVLPIARLELGIATDVDELELEVELGPRVPHDLERALAESAVGRVVEDDVRYG